MGKNRFSLFLMLFCLLLTACAPESTPAPDPVPPVEVETPGGPDSVVPAPPEDSAQNDDSDQPSALDHLTVEVVVDWADSDRILSELETLSQLMREALAAQNWEVDSVSVTISTAGGFTAEALEAGGVDIACLPGADYVARESGAHAVLFTDEDVPLGTVAVTAAREELDQSFRDALAEALLHTDAGAAFLSACSPDAAYVPAGGTAFQALRDWAARQAEEEN